ncbi:Ig-like domain-containing protein, partial [Bacillus velezensis]|uniref:Ig-like domain-containing protein n=1 Tax=Bacillus velezensis TaxID=492670 RepID=UPI002FFD95D1
EDALKLAEATPITPATTKEQVELVFTQVTGLIAKVKDEAKKTAFTTKATQLKEAALAKIAELAVPKVDSVTAINGIQLEVKFNKAVDVASAEIEANYNLANITGSAVGATPASAVVKEDGKTVVLTLAAAATTKTTFTLAVSGVKIGGSLVNDFPLYSQVVTVDDTTNAVVSNVVSKTNSNVASSATVYFSEPVTGGAIKLDGSTVPYSLALDGLSATISGLSLDASKNHTIEVVNLSDAAGNINTSATKEFTVTKDVAAPTFAVSTESDEKIVLTFDKAVDASTVSGATLVLKDEALDTVAGYSVSVPAGYGNKRVEITLPAGTYASKTTRNYTILASDAIKDSLGNKLAATSKTASISKDVTAPVLSGVEYVKDAAGEVQFVLFKYNEKVKETATLGLTATN